MQFSINGRFLSQPITGVQRFAREIVSSLNSDGQGEGFPIVAPRNVSGELLAKFSARGVGQLTGQLWEQIELPYYTKKTILVNLCNTAPLMRHNQVVTIHDTAVFSAPGGYSQLFLEWYKFLLPKLCHRATKIITVSQFSKGELIRRCGVAEHNIEVIPNGVDHIDRIHVEESILERVGLLKRPYVLAVGSLHPNKNIGLFLSVARALSNLDVDFVVVGGANKAVFANANLVSDYVRFLGYVTDPELKALYRHAACFVFPSKYEGFGIPPLEAMRMGCPVVVSNSASLPEVCGEAALYASPESVDEFSACVKDILSSAGLAEELRERGLARSKGFTWAASARGLLRVLDCMA